MHSGPSGVVVRCASPLNQEIPTMHTFMTFVIFGLLIFCAWPVGLIVLFLYVFWNEKPMTKAPPPENQEN